MTTENDNKAVSSGAAATLTTPSSSAQSVDKKEALTDKPSSRRPRPSRTQSQKSNRSEQVPAAVTVKKEDQVSPSALPVSDAKSSRANSTRKRQNKSRKEDNKKLIPGTTESGTASTLLAADSLESKSKKELKSDLEQNGSQCNKTEDKNSRSTPTASKRSSSKSKSKGKSVQQGKSNPPTGMPTERLQANPKDKKSALGTVTSLQQKIDELKTLPPAPVNMASLSRKSSLATTEPTRQSQIPGGMSNYNNLDISHGGGNQGRLKPDAPVFQPWNSSSSPTAAQPAPSSQTVERFQSVSPAEARQRHLEMVMLAQAEQQGQLDAQLGAEQYHPQPRQVQQYYGGSQNLQPRQSSGQQSAVAPRFSNSRLSVRDMPVYEEAVDDRNDLPSPLSMEATRLAPNFQFGGRAHSGDEQVRTGLDNHLTTGAISPPVLAAPTYQSHGTGGGGSSSGINANMLAGIAARANQRHQAEYNPVLEQQLMLQRQIELLQEQQRVLMQQNSFFQQSLNQPSQLSALSQALLTQQAHQAHTSSEEQARLLQEQYIKVLTAQSLAQGQQLAMHQPQPSNGAEIAGLNGNNLPSHQGRPSRSGINDFVMPSMHQSRPGSISGSNDLNAARARPINDTATSLLSSQATHRRRNSNQTHRPQNSIIGSFGGFVADVPDDAVMAHHRANSRSAGGEWRNGAPAKDAVLDLASAQAQLQLLSNFRSNQVGGGGHAKMPSFSFPNMLPNLMMASTMGPATQSVIQQQQAFQMQLQQHQGPGPVRKSLFAPYLPQGSLPALLAAGKLVVGVLRVNKRNRSDAYVATDVLDADIYICGSKDRNRALEGDIVAIELLDVDEVWGSKKEKEEKKRKKEENSAYDQGTGKANTRKSDKKKDDVEVEGQGMVLFDDEEVTDEQRPTYAGHVVAVVERMTGQLFSGQLGVLRPSSAATKEKQDAERRERGVNEADLDQSRKSNDKPKIVWFKPTDKRVPLIAIPTEQAPPDFVEKSENYSDRLFVATIKRWPITSLHPFGALVEELGPIGDLEVESSALLKDCNFPTEEFQEATLRCLPPIPWTIPEREYEFRRDLTNERVFTIDPATAKDLDDALSIKTNADGTYEVGVHIADVSYFVRPNTALDRDARKRATSVYLVQRAVPMLPPLLSEELCSLVPGVKRLTFSVFFSLDAEGNVLSKTYSKSIITSCAKLSYQDAQNAIEDGSLQAPVQDGHTAKEIEQDIKALNMLAVKIRSRRFKDGALTIDQPKLSFVLDDEGKPTDVRPYERTESHMLIEEYMLLANMAVASVIAHGLPEQALLRRHEAPIARRVEGFVERAKRLGFNFEGTTSNDIQSGLGLVENQGDKLCVTILATRAMSRAKYFCAGMLDIAKYGHFALNAPVYTHFTSPIRRFADLMVHRMLEACLLNESNEAKFVMERDQVAKCAQHCNAKKDAAKIAQDQSTHLHLCYLIDDLTKRYGPVIRDAKVVGVLDSAFDVVVPEFRIEKRVHADKIPLINHVYDEHDRTLSLYWDTTDVLSFLAQENEDEYLKKVLTDMKSLVISKADVSHSVQSTKSSERKALSFDDVKVSGGHRIQVVRELQTIPVMIIADVTKSPPVIQCLAVSPFSNVTSPAT